MKKIIILLLFSVSCWSQANGFSARQKKLVWENVIISSETNIPDLISKHPRLKIISSNKSVYKGTGTLVKNTCPGASAFLDTPFSFNFEIELSDGKYRITVSDIVYIKPKAKKVTAEQHFMEKGTVRQDEVSKADLNCLDVYFNRIFTMTMIYKNKM